MKITLCGSMLFYKKMKSLQETLISFGHEVKIPQLALEVPKNYGGGKEVYFGQFIEDNGGIDAYPTGDKIWDLKEGAIRDHLDKNDVSSQLSYKQEIMGMKPRFLNGDIKNL